MTDNQKLESIKKHLIPALISIQEDGMSQQEIILHVMHSLCTTLACTGLDREEYCSIVSKIVTSAYVDSVGIRKKLKEQE